MKGKYITTSLMLAVLASGKNGISVLVDETSAATQDHTLMWSKTVAATKKNMTEMKGRDELKMA
ncbi:MAG: hypothetical protein V4450_03930 [Bacteroidota bacterium]